jgi:SAM-dependent methyltransferase
MSFVPGDVVILPAEGQPGRWVALNVFARTSLGISAPVLAVLSAGAQEAGTLPDTFTCWEIEYFSNENCLLADPSRFRRDAAAWREVRLDRGALDRKLRDRCILIDDEAAYRERFQPKRNLLDSRHFGNFHQQHGHHLMVVKRTDPAKWWMQQKFTEDYRAVRSDTLYGGIQWSFLKDYFPARIKAGMKVVDLGCGTGIYCNLMARAGAQVLGVDPSDEYLAVAREHALPNVSFAKMDIGAPGGLDAIPDASADLIFMSDALLFYFVPFHPGQQADMSALLADIRRILKPGGTFVSLEPHGAFYLCPWLGSPDRPFTILTEYLHKSYGIVPPFSWLMRALCAAGFAMTDMQELAPAEYFKEVDARGYHFASQFPLWQLLEFTRQGS